MLQLKDQVSVLELSSRSAEQIGETRNVTQLDQFKLLL